MLAPPTIFSVILRWSSEYSSWEYLTLEDGAESDCNLIDSARPDCLDSAMLAICDRFGLSERPCEWRALKNGGYRVDVPSF